MGHEDRAELTLGIGFAVWGAIAELAAPRYVIAFAAACGVAAVFAWWPRPLATAEA